MKQTITFGKFTDAFRAAGRKDQFSYGALRALYDYIEEMAEDTGVEYDLDVIALCCEFTEYKGLKEFQRDYGDVYDTIEAVEDATAVIPIPDSAGFIIQVF
jgi:hypothetical protein